MGKGRLSLTIDTDLIDMAKIRKFKDSNFSISEVTNQFYRDFFGEDVKDLEKEKVEMRKLELERELAMIKAQEIAMEKEAERLKAERIKKHGREFDPIRGVFVE